MAETRPAIDRLTLLDAYGTDSDCRTYLEELRWPKGITCPGCNGRTISRIKARKIFDCDGCRYQFSVTAGTLFHDSHLALPKWFLAIFLMCESRQGVSANQLKRMLKVSYKTAWHLSHRIRAAMADLNAEQRTGTVEVDETYWGGHRQGDKTPQTVNQSIKDYVRSDVNTNTVESVFSLFKRSLVGSFHQVSAKHLDRYLDEFEFRFNNRRNPYLLRDVLLRMIEAKALPYEKLTA
jgi:transposase-like protein